MSGGSVVSTALRATGAVLLLALSLLPLGQWLNIELTPALNYSAEGWWSGTAVVGLLTFLIVIVVHRMRLADSMAGACDRVVGFWDRSPHIAIPLLAMLATALYAFNATWVFSGKPLLIDEIVQVLQARIFVEGRLTWPLDAYPEFRSIMHLVEQDGRLYGQFPPGGPAMLALGELFGAPWLVNPVFGGLSVAALALALRWARVSAGLGLATTFLFACAPFVIFLSASHMNHVTSLTCLLIATAALIRATHAERDHLWAGLICGLGLGVAATIRPLDAAAWALPAAGWLGAQAVRDRRWMAFIASGVGVAVPMGIMMWVNTQMTGGALTFGYTVMWGESQGLGFGAAPWGEPHTVERGLAMIAAYFNRLNEFFFETPVPILVPVAMVIAWSRTSSALERYMMVCSGLIVISYFAYWHDGFYLGPRFIFTLAPLVALLVARFPGVVAEKFAAVPLMRQAAIASFVAAAVAGLVFVLPIRIAGYRAVFSSFRWDYGALAAAAGARDSSDVVIVRESWGAQVMVRMWALGVPRSQAESFYRLVDTCALDGAIGRLEVRGVRGEGAIAAITPLLADSARVVKSTLSVDDTERVLPGSTYPPRCFARLREDSAGFAHLVPTWLERASPVRWVRDLQARDTLVVQPTDRVWLLRGVRADRTSLLSPVIERIDGDSLRAAWGRSGQ